MKIKSTDSKIEKTKNEPIGRLFSGNSPRVSFKETLKDSEAERRKHICDNLLKEIDTVSEELKKALTPERFKRYRELVSSFMKEALNQSYTLQEETRWDRSGNRKTFITVKKINETLEELMNALVSEEKKQIDLIAKLDEIRGMLLDLYL